MSVLRRSGRSRQSRQSREVAVPRLEEVVVLALAATRLARAVSVDEITAGARERLGRRAADRGGAAWSWADRLVRCPLCTGWWTSLAVSAVAPGRARLLRGVAVSGAQVLLSLAERLVSEEGRVAIERADALESGDGAATGPQVSALAGVGNGR